MLALAPHLIYNIASLEDKMDIYIASSKASGVMYFDRGVDPTLMVSFTQVANLKPGDLKLKSLLPVASTQMCLTCLVTSRL